MNKTLVSLNTFKDCFLPNNYNENMFNEDGTINNKYNSFKKTGIISQIFEDHWDSVYAENKNIIDKFRPNASKEIAKVINCHNKSLGCDAFECPKCHDIYFISYTCKSRFCSSCGYKYKLVKVENILEKNKINYVLLDRRNNYDEEAKYINKQENKYEKIFERAKKSVNIVMKIQKINQFLIENKKSKKYRHGHKLKSKRITTKKFRKE